MKVQIPNRKGKYSQCSEIKTLHNNLIISQQIQTSNEIKLHPKLHESGYQLYKTIAVLIKSWISLIYAPCSKT